MTRIIRAPDKAAKCDYDLIIIGGGIYGAMLSLEASRRGIKILLLERDDFGAHTSFNSLRIIHGGLRYLQNLDLPRFRESVQERQWFLKTFPNHVRVLPCLMPLYGEGMRRPGIFRLALFVNHLLSLDRNAGVREDRHLAAGRVMKPEDVQAIFPAVNQKGLQGGAIWFDACIPNSQRLLIDILHMACGRTATALNYVEVTELTMNGRQVSGVQAIDRLSGKPFRFRAKAVVNAAGPWCRGLASQFHKDIPELFKPSLAWNVLINKDAFSSHALAVAPQKTKGRIYFVLPWKGKVFAGTGHAPWKLEPDSVRPSADQLDAFLADINSALPFLGATKKDILHVFSGLLPAANEGKDKIAVREVIFNHGAHAGPTGFYSVSGVKLTTSRLVAEKTLKLMAQDGVLLTKKQAITKCQKENNNRGIFDFNWRPDSAAQNWHKNLEQIIDDESVQHLDDLIFRRTTLWENPERLKNDLQVFCNLFEWDESRKDAEVKRLKEMER